MTSRLKPPLPAAADPDGRVRRGERNRARILEALFELVRDGELMPTAEQVAERAGVGTRTVFRHFAEMEALHREISARVRSQIAAPLPDLEGDLEERARGLVRARVALFERVAPFKRAGNLQRWHSEYLRDEHEQMVRELRRHLLHVLPELGGGGPLLEAADLMTSFEAWDRLRADQRLGRERASEVLEIALLGLLADL